MNTISVIIPVYNVEAYLRQCLDSILNQTYRDLEIILVNDGSTDSSPQICEEYGARYSRITLIHKTNGGLSDARNAGLKVATGAYISFVDSDDLIALDFYDKMLSLLISYKADIVECNPLKFKEDFELPPETFNSGTVEIYDTEQALRLLISDYIQPVVWNKLYNREVLTELEFPLGKIHEDVFWTYQAVGKAKKFIKISDALYFYRQQENSIMGQSYSLVRLDAVEGLEGRIYYMERKFPELTNLAIRTFCFGAIDHYDKINEHSYIDPDRVNRRKLYTRIKKFNTSQVLNKWDVKAVFWYKFFLLSPSTSLFWRKYLNRVRKLE